MSRYYGQVIITFTDGSVEKVGGNRARTHDGILVVCTEGSYGGDARDVHHFPLVNIRSWRWEGE